MLRSVALLILLHFVQLSGAQDVGHDSGTRPTSVEQQPEVRPSEVGATESEDDDGYAELAAIYAEPESETRPVSVEQQLDEDTPPVPPTLPPTYLEQNFPSVKGPKNCRHHSGNEDACDGASMAAATIYATGERRTQSRVDATGLWSAPNVIRAR